AALPLAEIHAETPAQRSRALQLAQQVRTAQPDNARAARLLGLLALRAGEHDRAVTLLTEAMLKQTDDARVCVWLGDALQSLQRLPEARAAWRRALERGLTGTEAAELQQRLNETPAS